MTILSVVQAFATKVGIDPVPTSLFSATDRTAVEIKETANECAQQILQAADWTDLKKIASIEADGVLLEFPLDTYVPDFKRFLKKANLWLSPSPHLPFMQFNDLDEWLGMSVETYTPFFGGWILYGNSLHVRQGGSLSPVENDALIQFAYISKNIVRPASGALKASFTADTDSFVLDERLLKLCMIWNWKSAHGQPYAQELDDYETALAIERGSDRGPSILIPRTRGLSTNGPYRNVWP